MFKVYTIDGSDKSQSFKYLPALPITQDLVFETVFSADGSAVNPGSSVTIASDGLRVTATTTSGVAFIEEKPDPGAAGDRVRVRFK